MRGAYVYSPTLAAWRRSQPRGKYSTSAPAPASAAARARQSARSSELTRHRLGSREGRPRCDRAAGRPGLLFPAALAVIVLLRKPAHERLEVLGDGSCVDASGARELLHGVLPGLARAARQHLRVARARRGIAKY